jgi:hypothetical protein
MFVKRQKKSKPQARPTASPERHDAAVGTVGSRQGELPDNRKKAPKFILLSVRPEVKPDGSIEWGKEWKDLPNLGLYAYYEGFATPYFRRVFTAATEEDLRRSLESLDKKGMLKDSYEIAVCTAASKRDFPDPEFDELMRQTLRSIDLVRKKGTKEDVLRLRGALENTGKKRGPQPKTENKRWLIDLLAELAADSTGNFKGLIKEPWKPKSARTRLARFCWEFYMSCVFFGVHDPDKWKEPYVAKILAEKFGFYFLNEKLGEHDVSAALEAYRRGKQQAPEPPDGLTVRLGPVRIY